ncbi:MAG TPA: zinc-dependent metalloprotease [Isosphaeraceae bacterium]|jgi:hypothetical protein|nr:zinc-dependent metalloprotease [Isosphaeraceae bacterium]
MRSLVVSAVVAAVMALPAAFAQDSKDAPKDAPKSERKTPKAASKGKTQPYDDVITKEAKSSKGLFWVHRIDDKVFYEIPTSEFGKDMLWVTQLAATQSGHGYGGSPVGDRVVRWEQRGEDVLLRDVKYSIRAEAKDPIHNAVEATSVPEIIEVFPVKAYGKDKAPVIEVTSVFTADLPEFSAKRRLNAAGIDPKRTFIDAVKAFPENIETKVLMTYRPREGQGFGGPLGRFLQADPTQGGITVILRHSMVKLPEEPMKPRRFDDRVGFFTEEFEDYGNVKNHQVEDVRYITRWRLEKKDPDAELSEPKKPIVFYVGREVPDKWRPYVRKGIEAWQVAFEKAGFKNAILAKDAPSEREDPDWDAEDARYSSIRWLPAKVENAMGPHVHDPRTGEILESDILMYHNVLKLIRDWYFVQASPNDPKAQTLPLSDELIGEILAYVVSHEVGHTLGFPHNMKASSSYTVEQLRDPKFTKENGVEASIMDYGRFNYVAQPGDGARLIPIIGPYDKFAVEWGYKRFPKAKTYEDEKKELDAIVARQLKDPTLRFGDPNPIEDPSQQTEDLGSDPLAATTLGLKNLDRVAGYLVKATAKKGEDYEQLRNMYSQLVSQRNRELGHVANMVGGFVRNNIWYGDGDRVYEPVAADRQRAAVKFLAENAFQTPKALVEPDILERLESHGAADRILNGQRQLLRMLLIDPRLQRMAEFANRDRKNAYLPVEMLSDLHDGIFSELKADSVEIDLYRRNLQRAFVEILIGHVEPSRSPSELSSLARGELLRIRDELSDKLIDRVKDTTTRYHLLDLKARIVQALEPHPSAPSSGPPRIIVGPGAEDEG